MLRQHDTSNLNEPIRPMHQPHHYLKKPDMAHQLIDGYIDKHDITDPRKIA